MNGNQRIKRNLDLAFVLNQPNKTKLVSARYLHEVKQNMDEYILGSSNISYSSAGFPLLVNLESKYNQTVPLRDAILKIEYFTVSLVGRSGRVLAAPAQDGGNTEHSGESGEPDEPRNTGSRCGNKYLGSLFILAILLSFC